MKSKIMQICAVVIFSIPVIMGLSLTGCKNFGVPDFELKVTVEDGVQGTPAGGVYTYQELTVVDYSYSAIDDQYTVEVLVNGARYLQNSFVMYTNLEVVARIIDIRGTWDFTLKPESGSDEEDKEIAITFSGQGLLSGSFSDDQGHNGTWTIDGAAITITYNNWFDYELTGFITTMSGEWEGEGIKGTWTANREEESG